MLIGTFLCTNAGAASGSSDNRLTTSSSPLPWRLTLCVSVFDFKHRCYYIYIYVYQCDNLTHPGWTPGACGPPPCGRCTGSAPSPTGGHRHFGQQCVSPPCRSGGAAHQRLVGADPALPLCPRTAPCAWRGWFQ